jgi:hypothetical protein
LLGELGYFDDRLPWLLGEKTRQARKMKNALVETPFHGLPPRALYLLYCARASRFWVPV